MDDLIRRQAAIDAFDSTGELIVGGSANAQNVANYINKVVGKIKALPSAQPEIIRCKECIYYRQEIDMCDRPGSTAHNIVHEDDYCSKAERKTDERMDV